MQFGRFVLEPADRTLTEDGVPLDCSNRYFDALALLVAEAGSLVTKDRFHEEVWRGVPVTDEALTQCIRTLRRLLGDSASDPSFIETVPKHGYRFIASVEPAAPEALRAGESWAAPESGRDWTALLQLWGAGTLGGALAGLVGGLFYGFGATVTPGMGSLSVLVVIASVTLMVAALGAAAVCFGIAVAEGRGRGAQWMRLTLGGALGGLVIGGLTRLLGLDAFQLMLGRSPGNITGAPEGALLGAAVGLGVWLALHHLARKPVEVGVAAAGAVGASAGLAIALAGGRLMGGSLDLFADRITGSKLSLDAIGGLFGENGFGVFTRIATSMLEGALFAATIAAAMLLIARRRV